MNAGTAAALAAALGVASEATGVTNVTPLGPSDGDSGRGEPPELPEFPDSPGIDPGAIVEAVRAGAEAAEQAAERTPAHEHVSESLEVVRDVAEARERTEQAREVREQATEWLELIDDATEPTEPTGPGDSPDDTAGTGDPDDFHLQQLAGKGPFGIGTVFAAAGESGAAAGDAGDDFLGFVETGAAGWDMLLTGETTDPRTGQQVERPTLNLPGELGGAHTAGEPYIEDDSPLGQTVQGLETGAAGWEMLLTGETTDPRTGQEVERPTVEPPSVPGADDAGEPYIKDGSPLGRVRDGITSLASGSGSSSSDDAGSGDRPRRTQHGIAPPPEHDPDEEPEPDEGRFTTVLDSVRVT